MNNQIETQKPLYKTRAHDNGFDLIVALPGLRKENLEVNIEKRTLTLAGDRQPLEGDFLKQASETFRFELKVNLHEDLDTENIKATHQEGQLILTFQKRKELAPRKIDILAN